MPEPIGGQQATLTNMRARVSVYLAPGGNGSIEVLQGGVLVKRIEW